MKLHPIKHDLPGILWCGPAALSVCTGLPTSRIHSAIREARKNPSAIVKGVHNRDLKRAAELLGFVLVPIFDGIADWRNDNIANPRIKYTPTLARFVREHRANLAGGPVIVNVTGHYVVVNGRTFIDNQVRTAVPLRRAPGRRRRVRRAWRVVRLQHPV